MCSCITKLYHWATDSLDKMNFASWIMNQQPKVGPKCWYWLDRCRIHYYTYGRWCVHWIYSRQPLLVAMVGVRTDESIGSRELLSLGRKSGKGRYEKMACQCNAKCQQIRSTDRLLLCWFINCLISRPWICRLPNKYRRAINEIICVGMMQTLQSLCSASWYYEVRTALVYSQALLFRLLLTLRWTRSKTRLGE